jgi:hypothetical protein
MPQQANDGVRIAVTAGHYEQAVNGYLVQTEKQGDGNAEIA